MVKLLPKAYFATLLTFSLTAALGQSPGKEYTPENIEILLNTDGELTLNGVPATSKTSTDKAQNPANDGLVRQSSSGKETKIFTTKTDARASKKHEKLGIDIPDGSLVSLRTQKGDVTLSGVNAYLSGHIQSGAVELNDLKGEVELVSEQGDISATGVEAGGMLIARQGSIRLTDVTGLIATHAPQGKISLLIGANYYKKSPKPLAIELPEGEIEISSAPYGGQIQLGKGSLTVTDISQPLTIRAETASITIRGLAAPLSLHNRGNVVVQLAKFPDRKDESPTVDIETSDGDLTLELAKNFEGRLVIWTTERNPTTEKAPVDGTVSLGKASVADNGFGNGTVTVRETTYTVVVGKGAGPKVSVHVTNGKVTVNN